MQYITKNQISQELSNLEPSRGLGLGDIPVLRYYRDKYIHDNIIMSILAYRDNRANNNTATTVDTTSTKSLSAIQCSICNLKTSSLQCSTTCILGISQVHTMVC